MRNIILRYLHLVSLLLFSNLISTSILAGPEHENFLARISAYKEAQNQQPDRLIRYDDDNGDLIRELFDPDYAIRIANIGVQDKTESEELAEVTNALKEIAIPYGQAFQRSPAQFEREYLDAFESMIRLAVAGLVPVLSIDLDSVEDENMKKLLQATKKLAIATLNLLVTGLSEQFEKGAFSESFESSARERLAILKDDLNELGIQSN